ncbi:OmpA family protein [Glycocaulis profundi]|jgi:chemotaxis protein MotB|nr:OmpA family protein [Glycocaulis profundi]
MASDRPIIIKKVKKAGHGHHGGAWKVAYADFVTAMMAFFLLMWLINTASPEQKRGIADYFAPASVSPSTSGSGGIFGGREFGEDGSRASGSSAVVERLAPQPVNVASADQNIDEGGARDDSQTAAREAINAALARRENAQLQSAEMTLRQAMQEMPELAELSRHILIDQTPEGLRIQIVDEEGRPMFAPGATDPNPRMVTVLRGIADVIDRLPNRITVAGHTDASPTPASGPSNWELSSARANASLRVLQDRGISDDRVSEVRGKGASEPLFPDDPYMAGNRRLSIVLLREAPVLPPGGAL